MRGASRVLLTAAVLMAWVSVARAEAPMAPAAVAVPTPATPTPPPAGAVSALAPAPAPASPVPALAPPFAPAVKGPAPLTSEHPSAPVPITRRWWFWAGLSAAAVAVIVAAFEISPREAYMGNTQPPVVTVF